MLRCGVDIIEIERVAKAWRRRPRLFMKRFFTVAEARQLAARKHPEQHLAARFAAKEAVFKVLGAGMGKLSWTDVEILSEPGGAPAVALHGRAAERAHELGINHIAVSLSHSRDYAVAQAVAQSGDCYK
jgi:holo-[acyl-carrier protein] synthase